MTELLKIFTGKITYKNNKYPFVFDGNLLRLLPIDKEDTNSNNSSSANSDLVNFFNPSRMEDSYLRGIVNENKKDVIFLTEKNSLIGVSNSVRFIKIIAFLVFDGKINKFYRMTFLSPEINAIYPANQAIDYSDYRGEKGVYKISTRSFEESETEKRQFTVDEKNIDVSWGISRGVKLGDTEYPICVKSMLFFDFEPTEDFTFSYTLWNLARKFINYLCYRRNTWLPTVVISGLGENGFPNSATLNVLGQDETVEEEAIRQRRFISQSYIEGHEGDILQDIAKETLYLRHLPETYRSGNYIDASRFVMITAAFEREFKRLYPEGIVKEEIDINVEKRAKESIEKLIQEIEDGQKTKEDKLLIEKYKYILKSIPDGSLAKKICYAGKQIDDVVGIFAKYLYSTNGGKPKYKSIGQRLATQRNNFAHGNIEEKFIGTSLFDLVFLERIVYAMQLKHFGVDDKNIQMSINELFNCGIFLGDIVDFSDNNQP